MWYDARESTSCTKGNPGVPCYRMWARKSTDNGVTWLADMTVQRCGHTPARRNLTPTIVTCYAGDYDYGSAIAQRRTSLHGWTVACLINNASQQDTFFDQEAAGGGGTPTPTPTAHQPQLQRRHQPQLLDRSSSGASRKGWGE